MTGIQPVHGERRLVFSTDELPQHSSEGQRFEAALQALDRLFGGACGMEPAQGRPFRVRVEVAAFADASLIFPTASISHWSCAGTGRETTESTETLQIGFNRSAFPLIVRQCERECVLDQGDATVVTMAKPIEVRSPLGLAAVAILNIPATRWHGRVLDIDKLMGTPAPRSPALRHLHRYMTVLARSAEIHDDPACATHVANTLVDLTALVFGAQGDSAVLARLHGVRQTRLGAILQAIKEGYASPDFSAEALAARVGLSQRYIQELLRETGRGHSERVQELRLLEAHRMLANAQYAEMKIIDVALASGFGDVSYFNRCFRRRFGLTPTQARAGRRRL